jgi:hypothetical protein
LPLFLITYAEQMSEEDGLRCIGTLFALFKIGATAGTAVRVQNCWPEVDVSLCVSPHTDSVLAWDRQTDQQTVVNLGGLTASPDIDAGRGLAVPRNLQFCMVVAVFPGRHLNSHDIRL